MEALHALELLARILVERAVVVQDVYELELVPHPDLVIVRVVRGRDLHRTRPELHVDDDVVRDDRDEAVDERMFRKLAVEVLSQNVVSFDM